MILLPSTKTSFGMIAVSLLLLVVGGCSTVEHARGPDPDYRPIAGNSFGYSDRRIQATLTK